MDSRQFSCLIPDALTAEAAYIAALNRLARCARLNQELIESAKVALATGAAAEIEEVKRDAALLIERHLAANKTGHDSGLECRRALGAAQLD